MRYYISDLHFFHDSLNEFMDMRGFENAEAMNEYMIERWNKKVRRGDDVIILGDFSIGKGVETGEILGRLNGSKYLIRGNHDKFLEDRKFNPALFRWVKDYMELKDNKRKIILSHYPIFCYNGQYRLNSEGQPNTYMLYGHVHNSYDEIMVDAYIKNMRTRKRAVKGQENEVKVPCQMINCFCMFSDYTPLTLDEWIELDKNRRDQLGEK